MRYVKVELPADSVSRSYDIMVRRGLLDEIGPSLSGLGFSGSVTVITNPLVASHYADRVRRSLEGSGFRVLQLEMPDGEEFKNLCEVSKIYDALIEAKTERTTPVVALGGGVTGDLAGFVSATYLRGVPYVQVPTTLLSQVDSSIGGKTAVNHPKGKNLIGSFYQPRVVFIDPDVLRTLEERDVRSGLAEVVKHAAIRDESYFTFLEENAEGLLSLDDEIIEAIERSCVIKAGVVSEDERETGVRAILNFGHTFGHAIEAVSGYGRMRHGEAVAIGMVMAAGFSEELGYAPSGTRERIEKLLSSLGLPTSVFGLSADEVFASMLLDKKVKGGGLRFVLIKEIGEVFIREVSGGDVKSFLDDALGEDA